MLAANAGWNTVSIFASGLAVGYSSYLALLYLWKRLGDEDGCVDIVLYRVVEALVVVIGLDLLAVILGGNTALIAMGANALLLIAHTIIRFINRRYSSRDKKMHKNISAAAGFGILLTLLLYFVGR